MAKSVTTMYKAQDNNRTIIGVKPVGPRLKSSGSFWWKIMSEKNFRSGENFSGKGRNQRNVFSKSFLNVLKLF